MGGGYLNFLINLLTTTQKTELISYYTINAFRFRNALIDIIIHFLNFYQPIL